MRVLAVSALTASVVASLAVGRAAGPLPGLLVFTALAALGMAALGACRNRRDALRRERKLVTVPIHRVVRDDAPLRGRR